MSAAQMQAGFVALRPTSQVSKIVAYLDKPGRPAAPGGDGGARRLGERQHRVPGRPYVRYIKELYQENQLVRREHRVAGRPVDLGAIKCPVLTVTTTKDAICPPPAALALNTHSSSEDVSEIAVPGGHVGAVIGDKAKTLLYPQLSQFFRRTKCNSVN
jgi:poly(3-hydroxyalkanoate) synthetase